MAEGQIREKKQTFLEMLAENDSIEISRNYFYKDGERTEFHLAGCSRPPKIISSKAGLIGYVSRTRIYIDNKYTGYKVIRQKIINTKPSLR